MRTFLSVVAATLVLVAGGANAHTKAIGYHNSGPGCVTFWFQSWHSYVAPFFEGSFELVGINDLLRLGWGRDKVKAGDVINVDGFGARNGTNTANAASVTLANTGELLWASVPKKEGN